MNKKKMHNSSCAEQSQYKLYKGNTCVTHVTQGMSRKILGRFGENIASWILRSKGYLEISRNVQLESGEIDILTYRQGIQYLIEVKTAKLYISPANRSSIENTEGECLILPEENLSRTKIRKLRTLRRELLFEQTNGKFREVLDSLTNSAHLETRIVGIAVHVFCSSRSFCVDNWKKSILKIKVKYFPI